MRFWGLSWVGFLGLLCLFFFNGAYAVQQPAVALFDNKYQKILSTTLWSDIDFGRRNAMGAGRRPARVFALEAALPVEGDKHAGRDDVKTKKDLFFIPYCSPAPGAGSKESCSLSHYAGYVFVRFRGGWEENFAISLWQDSTPSVTAGNAQCAFREAFNDSSITFPVPLCGPHGDASASSGLMRRYESTENCDDFTDECFQARYMTYTTSFKEIPLEKYTGRMIFHVGLLGAWNRPWSLRVQSRMPHESFTVVDIVLLLVDTRESLNWSMWLTSTFFGHIFLFALCILEVVCFILGIKELGMRFSYPNTLNERHATVLYEENDSDDAQCLALYRIMLACKETCMKIISQLSVVKRAMFRYFCRRQRRGLVGGDSSNVVIEGGPREEVSTEGTGQKVVRRPQMESVEMNDIGSEESDNDDLNCRICRCRKPADGLFAPCACDGSSKYVHRSCLERWRAMTSNAEHRRVCAECKTPYVLVSERVPVSPDEFLHSPVCVPACRLIAARTVRILLILLLLCGGGYYLKICMYLVTGFDEGIVWSAANFYHWVLGVYSVAAMSLNLWALEYVLTDFSEAWQQLMLLVLSLCTIEIPLSYVGQIILSWLLDRPWSLEVSYALGIIVTAMSSVTLFPHLYLFMQSLSTEREVVAPRVEGVQNRIIL